MLTTSMPQSIGKPARKPILAALWAIAAAASLLLLAPTPAAAAACTEANQNGCVELSSTPVAATTALPPNIMFLLDDSGSMAWDVMPDWGYLSSRSDDALINWQVNGVYYNPNTTYKVPPKANGTSSYPDADFGAARVNGFDSGSATVAVFAYDGGYDESKNNESSSRIHYSAASLDIPAANISTTWSCPSYTGGASGSHPGYCYGDRYDTSPGDPYDFYDYGNDYNYVHVCGADGVFAYSLTAKVCIDISSTYAPSNSGCNGADQTASKRTGTNRRGRAIFTDYCVPMEDYSMFIYTTQAGGTYTRHYVAETAADCTTAKLPSAVCTADAAIQQNVANWFSYYHTRMLMAKSAVMLAMSSLSPNYRFGFGSINGNNDSNLPSPTSTNKGVELAQVAHFGEGGSTSQKADFWSWLDGSSPGNSTPLREALESAGEYYQEKQPWTTLPGDPNYVPAGDNTELLSCRASYTILTTDGFWNRGDPSDTLGGSTDRNGTLYTDNQGTTNTDDDVSASYKAVPPFSGGASNDDDHVSLADVAASYWKQDLMGGIANEVPTSANDPAFWQHMTTFTVGIGWDPVGIDPAGTTVDQIFAWAHDGGGSGSAFAIPGFAWPTPDEDSKYNIADMAHAAVVGHGDFFSAKDPNQLAEAFASALTQIAARNVAPTTGAANTGVAAAGGLTFNTGYNTSQWTGTFQAVAINNDGSFGEVKWDMGADLEAKHGSAYSTRDVYTAVYSGTDCANALNPTGGSFQGGVAFDASLPSSLDCWAKLGLMSPAPADPATDTAAKRIDYLLGDDSNEGSLYRVRDALLGAIVRSKPVYVGYPSGSFYDVNTWATGAPEISGQSYAAFVAAHIDRGDNNGTVFIGANDGMLHAFAAPTPDCDYSSDPANPVCTYDASGGTERWAFVPRAVYANLGNLTTADFKYRPTVDGTPITLDVFFSGDKKWHTVLVGGVGLGGRGVYALDVTTPTSFNAGSDVLWEFDSDMATSACVSNDGACKASDLGYTVTRPAIARLHNGDWVALVANGYFPDCSMPDVPTNEPEGISKPRCTAIAADAPADYSALFVVDVETGKVIAELKTPAASYHVTSFGLGIPVVGDYNGDGIGEVAFAGDLMGNLWRFDLSDADPGNWNVTLTYKGKTGSNGKQGVQPITIKPRLFPDPRSSRFIVVFGTGKYLGVGDNTRDIPTQAIYGVIEQSTGPVAIGDLEQQTLSESASGMRDLTDATLGTGKEGWYINLDIAAAKGERVVATPAALFATNSFVISTLIPGTTNYCNPSTRGAIMCISANNGGPGCPIGSGSHIGVRVTGAPTSGSLPIVSQMGGSKLYIPLKPPTDGTSPDPAVNELIQVGGQPTWRRRSWRVIDTDTGS